MKLSLGGLSGGGIKKLLLAHGEKLGIAVVAICALMMIYSTLSHESLPDQYQADNLDREIRQARQEVEDFKWDDARALSDASGNLEHIRVAQPLTQGDGVEVSPDAYGISPYGWYRPVVPPTVLRTDPVLLAAQDVVAYGGSGLLAFNDEQIAAQRQLELQAEQDRRQKEQEKERERQQQQQQQDRNTRERRNDTDRKRSPVDPEHPNRRPANRSSQRAGVALQGIERIETSYWATVVAKVPIRQQLKFYRDVLQNARGYDPQEDFPKYIGFLVKRTEVRNGEELGWDTIKVTDGQGNEFGTAVSIKSLDSVVKDWAEVPPEVVDEDYLDPDYVLAFPLPPLVGREWGEDATHPDIPLIIEQDDAELSDEPEIEEDKPDGAGEDELFARSDLTDSTRTGSSRNSRSSRRQSAVGRGGRGGYPPGGEYGPGEYGSGEYSARSAVASDRGTSSSRSRRGSSLARDVSDWLLRFYDFTVEPGKKYRYKVQLALLDVNCTQTTPNGRGVLKSTLDSEVLNRQEGGASDKPPIHRLTDWSEASPTVSIPLAGSVRLAAVNPPAEKLHNDEPEATLLVQSFGVDEKGQAIQPAVEEDFLRGSVANLVEDADILVEEGRFIDELKSFRFRTGITVIDLLGGDRLTRDYQRPARTLLMDPAGQLYVRDEMKDASDVEWHRTTFAKPDKKRGREDRGDDRGPRQFEEGFGGRSGR